ncbi:MAG: ClbS/DfsB family four-helix bundle protein [Deferribacteraceae bacterium]|jgi:hypothetical protein|nr:ClbS/DfsB family four-helix bundle protein [Deferribacteraceae bacterium]
MGLIRSRDNDEMAGKEVITPAAGYKWNQTGKLHQGFCEKYSGYPLEQLCRMFITAAADTAKWFQSFSDDEVFKPCGRKWAASATSNRPKYCRSV